MCGAIGGATFYKAENMKRYEKHGHKDTCMASVETHMNKRQRPTIMVDMEYALLYRFKKATNSGTVIKNHLRHVS